MGVFGTKNKEDQLEVSSVSNGLSAFIVEVVIFIVLTGIVLFTLSYFKVIDLGSLIPGQNKPVAQKNSQPSTSIHYETPSPTVSVAPTNIASDNIGVITKNNAWHFAHSMSEFEGKIVAVDTVGGVNHQNSRAYKVRLVIGVGKGTDTTIQDFPAEGLQKIKITDSKKNVISFADLKPGDLVDINIDTSLLIKYPNNLISVLITRK